MTRWNKHVYRSLLLVSFIGVNALILMGIGSVIAYLNTGAERSSILHLGMELEQVYLPSVNWSPLENEGRKMPEQTLSDIEEDYLKAWYVRSVALKNNDPYGLDDYYTDSMRTKLRAMIRDNATRNITINSTTINHELHLDFYSADGKLVSFTDSGVTGIHELFEGQELVYRYRDSTTYRVVMLLEDGFWRIRHLQALEKRTVTGKSEQPKAPHIRLDNTFGINYYPKSQPWQLFEQELDTLAVAEDLRLIAAKKLNTMRIFIPYAVFGKAAVNTDELERLVAFLDLAHAFEVKVIITLFDFYGNYDLPDWTLTHRHAETIVNSVKDHPALMAWDIKNEPDLDFKNRGKQRVLAWLSEMVRQLKTWDPYHPVTIGWSNPVAARELQEEVDFISFHYYEDPADFQQAFSALKEVVGDKEILLGEFGYSSYSGIANLYTGSEEKQAKYYQEMITSINQLQIPALFWTLHDFEDIPDQVVGKLPWRKARQKYFGLIRMDGSPKPAFALIEGK